MDNDERIVEVETLLDNGIREVSEFKAECNVKQHDKLDTLCDKARHLSTMLDNVLASMGNYLDEQDGKDKDDGEAPKNLRPDGSTKSNTENGPPANTQPPGSGTPVQFPEGNQNVGLPNKIGSDETAVKQPMKPL